MKVKRMLEERQFLEKNIMNLIKDFEEENGARVVDIFFSEKRFGRKNSDYLKREVKVEVEIW